MLGHRVSLAVVVLACAGCGKGAATPAQAAKAPIDADPYALLPPAAVVVARVDAAAVYANPAVGGELGAMTDALVPLGDEVGFRASRDVDRVLVARYPAGGAEVAAVLVGRFDVDRIAHATATGRGGAIVAEPHGARTVYRSGRVAWAPLTARTLVAGTVGGVGEVLDRVAGGAPARWEPAWMSTLLENPTAQLALAGDFASRPLASAAVGAVTLSWVHGIRRVEGLGVLKADAMDVQTTLSYDDPAQARDAQGSLERSVQMLDLFGPLLGGLRLQDFEARLDAQSVRCSFALDNQALRTLVDLAHRLSPS